MSKAAQPFKWPFMTRLLSLPLLAEKLDETIAAVEAFEETLEAALDELENVELPRGFGRD